MIRPKAKIITALMALAFIISGIETKSSAQPENNGWIILGPDGAGGNYIVGPAANSPLGQLGLFTNISLSSNGGDFVTLNPGAVANGSFGATIEFETGNNGFLNYGTVNAPNNDEGVFRNTGVGFFSSGSIINEGVINYGVINGGTGNGEQIASAGIGFWADNGIYTVGVINNGTINAGSNSEGDSNASIGTGIVLFDQGQIQDINGLYLGNTGVINGGTNVSDSEITGNGIAAVSFGNVQNVTFRQSSTGVINGGNNDTTGFILGSGVVLAASPFGNGYLANVSFNNAGNIFGGNNADHTNPEFSDGNLGVAGTAVAFWGGNGVYNIVLNNSGLMAGGSNDTQIDVPGNAFFDSGFVSSANNGLAIFDANSDTRNPADINGVDITNSGIISGGSNGTYAFIASSGVGIVGLGNVLNVNINNTSTGQMLGGNGGVGSDSFFPGSAVVGTGLGIAANVNDDGVFYVGNVNIKNAGLIAGGNNNSEGAIVGSGLGVWSGDGVYGLNILNTNTIIGGDNNSSGHEGAIISTGIGVVDVNFETGDINGVTIVNKGLVQGGNFNEDSDNIDTMAGVGIGVAGESNVSNVLIVNTGIVAGGRGNFNADFTGDGILVANGFGQASNIGIFNAGAVLGGTSTREEQDGPAGIRLVFGGNIRFNVIQEQEIQQSVSNNILVVNTGLVVGGNAGPGGIAGAGIDSQGDNVRIDNWGVIIAGQGNSSATVEGFPNVAIRVQGNNNVINLNGHSAVLGTIQGINEGNNVLNLNFTGLSPADILALKAQLASQGWPSTNNFTGIFTVRGITYFVDPVNLGLGVSSYQLQGLTPNQQSVGANLDGMKTNPTGDLLTLVNSIDQSGNVPNALEQLSPQPFQIYGDVAEAISNFNTLSIDHRLNNLRDGSESVDTTGLGGGSDHTTAGFSKDEKDNKGTIQVNAPEKRWGFFGTGSGLFSTIDGHGGDLSGAGFTTSGLTLGVDGKINDRFVAGLLFNYNHTSADLSNNGSTANIDTIGGGIYAGYHNGGWYGNGLATYEHNSYDSFRNIVIPGFNRVANGSTSGNQFAIDADGGYDFKINDRLTFGPLGGLQYMRLDVDGFNEFGAGAADLAVGSQGVNSLRSRIGVHADYHIQLNKEVTFATEVHAEWQHEFLDDSRTINGAFIGAGLGGFGVRTTNPERDAALLGVGVNFTVRDHTTFFLDYDAQVGQQDYVEHSVKGGLKIAF